MGNTAMGLGKHFNLRAASRKVEQILDEELGPLESDHKISPEFVDDVERFGGSPETVAKLRKRQAE